MTESPILPQIQTHMIDEASANSALAVQDAAFNLWLQRGLHEMFDNIADEPIPAALLALIENDRKR